MKFPSLPVDPTSGLGITFHVVDVEMPALNEKVLSSWLSACAKTYDHSIDSLSYVFCSDAYLHEMNVERLDHDTYTDIITFDLRNEVDEPIEGECYISIERITDNASRFGESIDRELHRVLVHGVLHLCGLSDKSEEDARHMREAEEVCLERLTFEA